MGPRDSARIARAPSSESTTATSAIDPLVHPGMRADRHLAAAAKPGHDRAARRRAPPWRPDRRSSRRPRRSRSSPSRISTAMMPCPGAGTHAGTGSTVEMRARCSSRISPADASTMASYCPSSTLRKTRAQIAADWKERCAGKQSRRAAPSAERCLCQCGAFAEPRHQLVERDGAF